MVKQNLLLLAAASLPLLIPSAALAQQQDPPVYTYVAEWNVERAHWPDFAASLEKGTKPILDRMVAEGAIREWGFTENLIHTPEGGSTHSIWWAAPNFSGTERVLEELRKSDAVGTREGVKGHRDYLFRSLVFHSVQTGTGGGYLMTSYTQVKPGKAREWRDFWEKHTRPVLEQLLEQKAILGYGVDVEDVHTRDPGGRYGWIFAPSAEAVDKLNAAFGAAMEKRTPDERAALSAAFTEITVPEAHRDGLERVVTYVRK